VQFPIISLTTTEEREARAGSCPWQKKGECECSKGQENRAKGKAIKKKTKNGECS